MAEFQYAAKNNAGKQVTGSVTAENETDALGELRRQNLIVISLGKKEAGGGGAAFGGMFKPRAAASRARVNLNDMIVFTRQLSTMLSAGIPLLECLEILAEQSENLGFRAVIEQMVDDVRSGNDFSESLKKHPRVFSNIYVNMIRAGEASGQLDEILKRLADYQEATAALIAKIRSAMVYPLVSLGMILAISLGLIIFIVPQFKTIFDTIGGELPRPTVILMAVSDFMSQKWYIWTLGTAAIAVAIWLWSKTAIGAWQIDWLKLRAPIFGPLFRKVGISRFARTFATLIESGVPILGALEIVASTAGNRIIENAVLDASESVRQGDTLASPLGKSQVFPPMVVRMIAIGEKSGALEALLKKISEFYDQQVAATVQALTSLIEPIMIGIMGVLVGGMVLAIFLPIFKMATALKPS